MPVFFICAPGRIRTFVARWATDLQSVAIDHSATDAMELIVRVLSAQSINSLQNMNFDVI